MDERLLLVDFDGTLCFDRFWRSIAPAIYSQIQAELFGKNQEMIRAWMRGQKSSEEVNHYLAECLGVDFEKLWQVFVADCTSMHVSPATLATIRNLRQRYRTILLTDNMDCFSRFTVPALALDKHFDRILNSADHAIMKGDNGGIWFEKIAQAEGLQLKNSWLIDNSPSACDHFSRRGGNACFVDKDRTADYWLGQLM